MRASIIDRFIATVNGGDALLVGLGSRESFRISSQLTAV